MPYWWETCCHRGRTTRLMTKIQFNWEFLKWSKLIIVEFVTKKSAFLSPRFVFGKLGKVTARGRIIWTIKGIWFPKSSTLFSFTAGGSSRSICFSEDDKRRNLYFYLSLSDTSQPQPRYHVSNMALGTLKGSIVAFPNRPRLIHYV